jgi:ureidoacrylate peracid hydrolase
MHKVSIRPHIVERVLARRGELHWFTRLEASKTALLVIDMQNTFCMPGAPGEVPAARAIVPNINRFAAALRGRGVPVVWILHANTSSGTWCATRTCAAAWPRAWRRRASRCGRTWRSRRAT